LADVTPIREIVASPRCCERPMVKTTEGQSVRDLREVYICRKCGNRERGALIVSPQAK
jgi:hypothetical protein